MSEILYILLIYMLIKIEMKCIYFISIIEILGPEKSIYMDLKSPDFRSPKSRGNPAIVNIFR